MTLKIKHNANPLNKKVCDRAHRILLALPKKTPARAWPDFGYYSFLLQRHKEAAPASDAQRFQTWLPSAATSELTVLFVDDSVSQFSLLSLMGKCAKGLTRKHEEVVLDTHALHPALAQRVALALIAALAARLESLPDFRRQPKTPPQTVALACHSVQAPDYKRTLAEAAGNGLARYLTTLPGNQLSPKLYVKRIRELARTEGWQLEFLDRATLTKKKAGAFLAVAQGNDNDGSGIAHLRYTPARARQAGTVALVGKGICFDTGGMNLKSAKYMHGMHEDMAGSAVALGTLLALSRLRVKFPVHCWLAITENHIGAGAYKQNDVVTALNGTTIEIVHTDAEGRMVLADTLTLAAKTKPALLIDYATLTGSCVAALGTTYSGVFGNRIPLLEKAMRAGQASGERVWAFPHDLDFDEDLESTIADIKQCTLEGGPDHILAARFLDRFVPAEIPWLHVDLSAGNHKGGLAHITSDITGFGVYFTCNLLLDQDARD